MFTLCILMNSSICFDRISLGWFIVHIKGSQVRINCKIKMFSGADPGFLERGLTETKLFHFHRITGDRERGLE